MYDEKTRMSAAELFSKGMKDRGVARALGISRSAARSWMYTYMVTREEAMPVTNHLKYSHELKVAAAKDVVEGGMTKREVMEKHGIASLSPLVNWCRAYQLGGPDALLPKPKGRKPKPDKPVYATREEELEARVMELELELEIQKRINALADEIEQKSHRR